MQLNGAKPSVNQGGPTVVTKEKQLKTNECHQQPSTHPHWLFMPLHHDLAFLFTLIRYNKIIEIVFS